MGYVRVSSAEENEARQLERIGAVDRLFAEEVSGAFRDRRTAVADCHGYVRESNVVLMTSMDRLARDLRGFVEGLSAKGATVWFLKAGQTCTLTQERPAEGIAVAKATGKYWGRAKKLTASDIEDPRQLITSGVPKAQAARQLEVSPASTAPSSWRFRGAGARLGGGAGPGAAVHGDKERT